MAAASRCPEAAGAYMVGSNSIASSSRPDHYLYYSYSFVRSAGASTCTMGSCPAAFHTVPCDLHLLLAGEWRQMYGGPGRCSQLLTPEATRSSSATCWCHISCSIFLLPCLLQSTQTTQSV